MLTLKLDPETEEKLADLLAHEKDTNQSELIKRLIRERWLAIQLEQPLVDRRGGHPKYPLLNAPADLSERTQRKQAIAEYLKKHNS